jgi:hypothetical protein
MTYVWYFPWSRSGVVILGKTVFMDHAERLAQTVSPTTFPSESFSSVCFWLGEEGACL